MLSRVAVEIEIEQIGDEADTEYVEAGGPQVATIDNRLPAPEAPRRTSPAPGTEPKPEPMDGGAILGTMFVVDRFELQGWEGQLARAEWPAPVGSVRLL